MKLRKEDMMHVKDVVTVAINHVSALFEHEQITNLGLEEIEFDDRAGQWLVTVGFSRPWDYPQNLAALAGVAKRSYKTIRVDDSGAVIGIKNREVMS